MTQFPGESQTEVIMELSQSGNHLIHRHALQVEPFVPGGGFRKKADSSGGAVVRSPMVGKILQVKVSEGETVKKGQELLTIEAMKMENKILASASGTVSKLKATPGEQTTIGAALLSIDADPS
ncbi:MAG: acetyl-CoA carboxylase biotin carboxyl carrier protein subunit [Pseudobacteriovorax sp.]|nr:acetyl-CoA carboxylase biotin carboxyl carrier protein subunit [Pseudobacteriovorax sp.]